MYRSILLDITKKTCTLLSKNKNSTLQNKNVGKIIKKLNKENKSLFGKLLETRQQKLKRQTKKSPNFETLSNENEMSSEAHWCIRKQKTSCRIAPKKIPSHEFEMEKCNKILNIGPKQNLCSRPTSLHNGLDSRPTSFHNGLDSRPTSLHNGLDSRPDRVTTFDNSLPSIHSNVGKACTKVGGLELPDVIIRNIPTFPLQSKNPKIIKWNTHNMPLQSPTQEDRPNCLSFPSVSKILSATMSDSSRAALNKWQQKMISELGEEGFLTYHRDLLEKGSRFHSVICNFLSGTLESELDLHGVEGCWHSMNDIIGDITDVKFLESHVVHPDLLYKGIIDCVASYKGKQVLIEWKRSTKQKEDIKKTFDAPVQLSAYVGAMNYDAKYDIKVQGGLIVVAYNDGFPAHIFKMTMTDCQKYWKMWLHRLQKYWLMRQEESAVHGVR